MLIISLIALLLSLFAVGWMCVHSHKANKKRTQINVSMLNLLNKQHACIVDGMKNLSELQAQLHQAQMIRANHDTACMHYTLAALRPYLFNVLRNAVEQDQFEDASVCREMINNIDKLLQTDFTKIQTK